jgi:formimidoylglutamate deiminase
MTSSPPAVLRTVVGDAGHLEWRLPAFATAHSHAFQRGMRGLAQRPGPQGTDDFWTWRTAMYDLALSLTPERIHAISRVAFRELRSTGTLTVGEFHYLHHQADGTPYEQRTLLADAVIEAALAEGLRISMLRTIYHRAGAGRPPVSAQVRFSDPRLDDALGDIETLLRRWSWHPDVRIGIAPHSVRAVPPAWLSPIAAFAKKHDLPLHMHIAEQPGEVEACLAETGRRPLELVAEAGLLSPRFVAVHGTHLAPEEAQTLGKAGGFVCINATTERDLGDGHPDVTALRRAGVRLCNGIDSHVATDPFEEMRGPELGERLRTLRRVTDRRGSSSEGESHDHGHGEGGSQATDGRTVAERLWLAASTEGAIAVGFADAGGEVVVDRDHLALALVDDDRLVDALVFSGRPDIVRRIERTEL